MRMPDARMSPFASSLFPAPGVVSLLLLRAEMEVQGFGYFEGGLFLKRKYILQIAGEIVSPGLKAGVGID